MKLLIASILVCLITLSAFSQNGHPVKVATSPVPCKSRLDPPRPKSQRLAGLLLPVMYKNAWVTEQSVTITFTAKGNLETTTQAICSKLADSLAANEYSSVIVSGNTLKAYFRMKAVSITTNPNRIPSFALSSTVVRARAQRLVSKLTGASGIQSPKILEIATIEKMRRLRLYIYKE